tara:strand:- start:460 stop:597 length:138 start_codon:yes stop_codon:yes gene_type:complete
MDFGNIYRENLRQHVHFSSIETIWQLEVQKGGTGQVKPVTLRGIQ